MGIKQDFPNGVNEIVRKHTVLANSIKSNNALLTLVHIFNIIIITSYDSGYVLDTVYYQYGLFLN